VRFGSWIADLHGGESGDMRVVVNQSTTLGHKSGIGYYTIQLLRCLRAHHDASIDAFPQGWLLRVQKALARAQSTVRRGHGIRPNRPEVAPSPLIRLERRVLAKLRDLSLKGSAHLFRSACIRNGYEVYHEPNYIPLPCDLPTVATIHDLSVLLHPEWHPADRAAYFERHFPAGLKQCRHFLTVSEFGRRELARTVGIPLERITATYNGIRPGLGPLPKEEVQAALRRLGVPSQYLLYLGTLEPRKNLLTLLRAYCDLPPSLRARWPLLVVGGWGWNTAKLAAYLYGEARQRGVMHLGYVPEEFVPALYNGARALVYPSLYEGFGLPPVEMLACGGAVLASTAEALVETIGGQAALIAPLDVDGWRHAMARVVQDDDWWRSLRHGAMAAAGRFTWERCAAQTLNVYRSLCGRPIVPLPAPVEQPRRAAG